MNKELLTTNQARDLVEKYIAQEGTISSTQEIIDSGEIPELKGYQVKPGKVSDSVFGGRGSFKKEDQTVDFVNSPLRMFDRPARIMVRTPRISTHDITRGEIPFKDQILALNHNFMREMVQDTLGISQYNLTDPNAVVIAAENLTQIGLENVLRAFMAKSSTSTSLYQHYVQGKREFCGHKLPEGLLTNEHLPYVMDTPSTKSDLHDESVSPKYLLEKGICTGAQYTQIINSSLVAFGMVTQFLLDKGLILVDTKTEHGLNQDGEIVSQDELYTMDSSRFWKLEDYQTQLANRIAGKIEEVNPVSYSKEFARGFSQGDSGYTDEQRIEIGIRYIEGIQHLLGKRFEPDMRPRDERVVDGLQKVVMNLQ